MRRPHATLAVIAAALGIAATTPAVADQSRGTEEQQAACTPDVFRLCGSMIPDADRIVYCLRQNTSQLSPACRAVFEPNDTVARYPSRTRRGTWQSNRDWQ